MAKGHSLLAGPAYQECVLTHSPGNERDFKNWWLWLNGGVEGYKQRAKFDVFGKCIEFFFVIRISNNCFTDVQDENRIFKHSVCH